MKTKILVDFQICIGVSLNFKLNFEILKELMNDFSNNLREHHTMAASANMFYIAIGCKNKANMKVAASNINIEIHQLFSEQRIRGVRVSIVQWKISVDLTRTCF